MAGRTKTGGRKKGTPNKRTSEQMAALAAGGALPLDIMLGAARAAWKEATEGNRVNLDKASLAAEIANKAAPYIHPRLASVEHKGDDGGPIRIVLDRNDEDV
ncbi:hypothetical protein ACQVP2_22385 [Methylobacterium aquaticum]|uniref:hypothetical protein n=1 Tax=Methylobacterium aquaticum TaxID=270351 RepID=UPI003D17D6B4